MADETNSTEATSSETTATTDATGGSDATTGSSAADTATDGNDADGGTVLGSAATDAGTGDGDAGKPEAGKDGADDAGKNDPVVPEKYEISLTVKDEAGNDQAVEIDSALLEAATPVLKDLGLTNEQANKVAGLVPQIQQRLFQQQADEFATTKTQWAKDAAADEEIGGKNWKESQTFAAKALDHFGAPKDSEFRKLLDDTGLGNHPEMIRIFRKVGAALGEETTFAQGDAKIQKKSREEELYPDDVPKK